MFVEMAFGLCLCLCVTCLWPSSHVSFSATFQQAILLASCNAILHWFSTRHGASELVRNFIFIYIMCTFASGWQCRYFDVSSQLSLTGVAFSHLIFASTLFGFGSCAVFSPRGLGLGGTLCFVSFHFLALCSVAGKMQVFLPTPTSGGLFAFSGDGLVPSKAQIALMMRKCNLVFV